MNFTVRGPIVGRTSEQSSLDRLIAAFAVSTAGLASSYLQALSILPERVLGLAGWITGLCALIFVWFRRPGSS
jgi:hypothetical protein